MKITPYKTHKIQPNEALFTILDQYLPKLQENSIIAIASKVVGICEGRVVKKTSEEQKHDLAKQEAEYYLSQKKNKYGVMLTINHNLIVASAGIDESNSNGYLSLWPKNPQNSINEIRAYLTKKNNRKNLGVIMTDSRLTPLRWGVTGWCLSHSGFSALNSYIDKPDIFGQTMRMEQTNVADSLASAATLAMGEGAEQQPLVVITDVPFVHFQKRNPTDEELDTLKIKIEDDVYAPMLTSVTWEREKGT